MDGIKSFFAKYHAVPANDAGPCWEKASDESLVGWAEEDLQLWPRTLQSEQDRGHLKARMIEIVKELWKRMKGRDIPVGGDVMTVDRRMRRCWHDISILVGFEHSV